jgi:hypothetical protein
VQLRHELAAAQDHERLSLRAAKLRWHLVEAPIVATSGPLRFGGLRKMSQYLAFRSQPV